MKFTINREKLLPALNMVNSVVEKRQTLPILSNLYFSHQDGQLILVGTDLEVEISQQVEGCKGDNGSFTVSSIKVLSMCRMFPQDADISFQLKDNNVIIKSGRSRFTLKTLDANEFPRLELGSWEERFKISQQNLKILLEKTAFAMAIHDVRFYLNGILFELSKNMLKAIATDGHRLAQYETEIALDKEETSQIIVPRKAILEINRLLEKEDEALTIELNKNHFKISRNETTIITKLIDGKFPEFKTILNTEMPIQLNFNRELFIETLSRIAILTTDRFRGIKMELVDNLLKLTVNNPEQESAIEEVEVDYSGERVETGFNVSYLIDAARVANSEDIELYLQGSDGISILREPKNDQVVWLVMPMRI